MANNYAPGTPVDKFGIAKVEYPPAKVALASTTKENTSASSILLLTHDTTEIEVDVISSIIGGGATGGVAGKWLKQSVVDSSVAGTSVITAAGSANYDFVVPSGWPRRFVVPVATQTGNYGSVMGVNRELGLYPAVAFKSLGGTGSVLVMEF